MMKAASVAALLAALTILPAHASDYKAGPLTIDHPWARPTAAGAQNGAAYFAIKNGGDAADKLLSVASPAAASVEVHESREEAGVMKMRPAEGGVEINAGKTVELKPGGYHVMLIGLKQPLKLGEHFPMTLTFEKAGTVQLEVPVQKGPTAGSAHEAMHDMHH